MKTNRYGKVAQLAFFSSWFPVNCYLVEDMDGLTLIDAGMPFFAKSIIRVIEGSGRPLVRILLTHGHEDHIGAVAAVKQAYPHAMVGISERDARLLAGDRSLDPGEPQTPLRGGIPNNLSWTQDHVFADGDKLGSLTVAACPGHTPGHVAFWHEESRTLIAGDAFQTRGGLAVSGTMRPTFPFPAWATWHPASAVESAKRLLDLQPARLAVGHGPVLQEPVEQIARAIEEAEKYAARRKSG